MDWREHRAIRGWLLFCLHQHGPERLWSGGLGQLHLDRELVAAGWWDKPGGLDLGRVGRGHPGLDTVEGAVVGLGPRDEGETRANFGAANFGNGDLFLLVAETKDGTRFLQLIVYAVDEAGIVEGDGTLWRIDLLKEATLLILPYLASGDGQLVIGTR